MDCVFPSFSVPILQTMHIGQIKPGIVGVTTFRRSHSLVNQRHSPILNIFRVHSLSGDLTLVFYVLGWET